MRVRQDDVRAPDLRPALGILGYARLGQVDDMAFHHGPPFGRHALHPARAIFLELFGQGQLSLFPSPSLKNAGRYAATFLSIAPLRAIAMAKSALTLTLGRL